MVSSDHHSEDGTSLPRWELEGKPSQVLGIRKGRKTPSFAGGDCRDRCPCGCFGPRNGRDRLSACVQEDGWPVEVVLNHPVVRRDTFNRREEDGRMEETEFLMGKTIKWAGILVDQATGDAEFVMQFTDGPSVSVGAWQREGYPVEMSAKRLTS